MSFEHPAFRPSQEPSQEPTQEPSQELARESPSQEHTDPPAPSEIAADGLTDTQANSLETNVEEVKYHVYIPYTPRGFVSIYEEAKHLRKHSGKSAVAFIMIFLVLYVAGSYAGIVESQRMNPVNWEAITDSLEIGSKSIVLERAAVEAPSFFERFGLKILSALGSIGFWVFAAGAVAEISFRSYEGRDVESYEVLDTLSKSQGIKLLKLGSFFMVLLLSVGLVSIGLTIDPESPRFPFFVILITLAQYYVLFRTVFAVYSMIGEDLSPMESVRRSWELTEGNFFRLLWWGLVFGFLFLIVTFFLYLLPVGIVSTIIVGLFSLTSPTAAAEVFGVLTLFILPFLARQMSLFFFFQMALYRELRLRYDGLDPQEPSSNPVPVSA